MTKTITLATRESPLAMWQAEAVKRTIERHFPSTQVNLLPLKSKGDSIQDKPLADFGGKGLFVKEIEQALLDGRADIAVHSAKDMPPEDPPHLTIAATLKREDPRDAWICTQTFHNQLPALVVGTASPRRSALLKYHAPAVKPAVIRGNLARRIERYEQNDFDAIVLAMAGIKRLKHPILKHALALDPEVFIPASGQGIIAMQCRTEDQDTITMLQAISDSSTQQCLNLERALVHKIQGNCHSPIGAFATINDQQICLHSCVLNPKGTEKIQVMHHCPLEQQQTLAEKTFLSLREKGALQLLKQS